MHINDAGQAVLPRYDGAMGEEAAHLRDQADREGEVGGPADVGERADLYGRQGTRRHDTGRQKTSQRRTELWCVQRS